MTQSARENILSNIRKALAENPVPIPFPEAEKQEGIFPETPDSIAEYFAKSFNDLGGKFVYCGSEEELVSQLVTLADSLNWKEVHTRDSYLKHLFDEHHPGLVEDGDDLKPMQVGLSLCECLVARTGSLILSSAQEYGRALPVYAPIHIAVAFSNQLVWNIQDAISRMKGKYPDGLPSMISLTTGPSRTADIEKTLVVGVHGPKEVYVFLVDHEQTDIS